jgi:hypothetical protein
MTIATTNERDGKPTGYALTLSEFETFEWAHRAGKLWPCSSLSGFSLTVEVDSNGLCGLTTIDEYDIECELDVDGHELDAIVSDHLPSEYRHLWPCWQ